MHRLHDFIRTLQDRYSIRRFTPAPVPDSLILDCIKAANTAPSGANQQPWHFVVVSNQDIKQQIRDQAEEIEYDFHHKTAPKEWLEALGPLNLNHEKPFLTEAPFLVVVFMQRYGLRPDGTKQKHYYPLESVGISTGMLLAALQVAGLGTLVYTPPKRKFLNELLARPDNEKVFAIIVTGHADPEYTPPVLEDKKLHQVVSKFI